MCLVIVYFEDDYLFGDVVFPNKYRDWDFERFFVSVFNLKKYKCSCMYSCKNNYIWNWNFVSFPRN